MTLSNLLVDKKTQSRNPGLTPELSAAAVSERPDTAWVATLSPWPKDGFGLERMQALLERLGHPERAFDAIHVVGTKGKSTATRTIAALLAAEGLRTGAYTSPHVAGWWERLDTDAAGFEAAIARVRPAAEALDATQFEILTAAAFADFAARGVEVAAVEAGLGGRLDATNVLGARVVLLTNVGLEHTEILGGTRQEIAQEKLAVAAPGAVVVLPDGEFAPLLAANDVRLGGAREAAEVYLGRPIDHDVEVRLAGRLEVNGSEVRDGAHTPDAVDWLLERLPEPGNYTVVASILGDKDAAGILERLAAAGPTLVATQSTNDRALPAAAVARAGAQWFARVDTVPDPHAALLRARELGHRVLVTGSLYLLADLAESD
jgi:dihydrofolate synthase/folylpolyglutamate synthase